MARRNRISLLLVLLFAALPALGSPPLGSSAESIVRSMSQKYSALLSYQDEGECTATKSQDPLRFSTWFVRPGRLRVEWVERGPRGGQEKSFLWSDGKTVHDSLPVYGTVRRQTSLQDGIATATGVSRMSAYTVPTLLVPEAAVQRLDQLADLKLDRRETFEGTECYVVSGRQPRSAARYTLWIGTGDLLLRRVRRVFKNGNVQDEVHRHIRLNEPIPAPVFAGPAAGAR